VPVTVGKLAPDGIWLAESVRLDAGAEDSVALTVNDTDSVWNTVSAEGADTTGKVCVPTVTVTDVVLVNEPLVPVMTTV
jgi:hypothetical protein